MKYLFIFVTSLFSINSYSQNSHLDFLQRDNKINWAAEYSQIFEITPSVRKYGLKQFALKQLELKGCIDTYAIKDDEIKKTKFCKIDNPNINTFSTDINPYKSYLSNINYDQDSFIATEKKCNCSNIYQRNKFDVYKLMQVLYYKDAKLFIKNILATPACLQKIIDSGNGQKFIWESCFSASYNSSENIMLPAQKKVAIDLGNREQLYDLNYGITRSDSQAKVFTLKNPIFSRHLFEDILSNRITVVDDKYNIIPSQKVLRYNTLVQKVPVYDMNGNFLTTKKIYPEVNIDSFYEFSINQHFYFGTTRIVLFSEVNYIEVYRNIITSQGLDLGKAIYFRIYFIAPSLYKKPKTSRILN